jgi:3-isopropylmalate/(R)-2-methylmalate dehydratase large subunit
MPSTTAEKILAGPADPEGLTPGDHIVREVDLLMMHDLGTSGVIDRLNDMGVEELHAPDRIVCPMDHVAPSHSVSDANQKSRIRKFVDEMDIEHFYEVGTGISHQILHEKGHYTPGDILIGTDSHTTTAGAFGVGGTGMGHTDIAFAAATGQAWFRVPETIRFDITGTFDDHISTKDLLLHIAGEFGTDIGRYRALEFFGDAIRDAALDDRATLANMSIELGAKFGFTPVDDTVVDYLAERTDLGPDPKRVNPDDNASYEEHHQIDLDDLAPKIATPHRVGNITEVSDAAGVELDQVFIGSCTNGTYADLAEAADVLTDAQVADQTRLIITPASRAVYQHALKTGVVETLTSAGATVTSATCGACIGMGMGVLGDDEVCLAAQNRNFQGRMGADSSEIYLSSPETAAASAIIGQITDPRTI